MGEEILKLNKLGVPIITYVYGGHTLRKLASKALIYASHHRNEAIFIYGGICDLAVKDAYTNQYTFVERSAAGIMSNIISTLDEVDFNLHYDQPLMKLIFAPLIGVDIYEYYHLDDHELQDAINTAIPFINRHISYLNSNNNVPTPWTARCVHKYSHGRNYTVYEHLRDGLHPNSSSAKKIAKAFIHAVQVMY